MKTHFLQLSEFQLVASAYLDEKNLGFLGSASSKVERHTQMQKSSPAAEGDLENWR